MSQLFDLHLIYNRYVIINNLWLYNNFLIFIFSIGHPFFLHIRNMDIINHKLDETLDNK